MKITRYVEKKYVNWSLHRDGDQERAFWRGFSIKVGFVDAALNLPITWLTWCRNLNLFWGSFNVYSEGINLKLKVKVVKNLASIVCDFKS
jgi:hypothetical protein